MVKRTLLLLLLLLGAPWQRVQAQRESAELKALRLAVAQVDSSDLHKRALALKDLGVALKDARRYRPALEAFNESAALNNATADTVDLAIALALLRAEVLTPLRKFPEALAWIEHAHALERILLKRTMDEQLRELEADFDARSQAEDLQRQKVKDQVEAERRRSQQRQLYGGSAIALMALIALIALLLLWRSRRQKPQREVLPVPAKSEPVAVKERSAEVDPIPQQPVLRTEMNPHFIHSSLGAIASMLRKNEAVRASAYLDGLLRWLRMLLDQSGGEQVPLEDGIAFLRQYLKMEALRFPGGLDYSVEAEPALLYGDGKVLVNTLLVQFHVENAIWQRLAVKEGAKRISVQFTKRDGMLIATVEDNGVLSNAPAQSEHPERRESEELRSTTKSQQMIAHELGGSKLVRYTELKDGERSVGTRVELVLSEG